jgi:hypothetical protein
MARRKAERPAERGVRRAETNAVAAYLTALRAPTGGQARVTTRTYGPAAWLGPV